jgi:hypothetical protein
MKNVLSVYCVSLWKLLDTEHKWSMRITIYIYFWPHMIYTPNFKKREVFENAV